MKKFFQKLYELITKEVELLDANLELVYNQKLKFSEREKWDLETGEKFNNLISNYAISEDELLEMSEVLCEFATQTRVTNIKEYLFVDRDMSNPRLPFMLKGMYYADANNIISELKDEMYIDEQGNNVLNGGTEEYEQKWKYEIGVNYGLTKAIRIFKKHLMA